MPSKFVFEGITELQKVAGNYARGKAIIHNILKRACNKFAVSTKSVSQNKYMSQAHKGERKNETDVLRVQSGQLRSRMYTAVDESENGFLVRIGVDNVPYAAIHEYGGTILRNGKRGRAVINIPERSYLRRALKDTIDPFTEDIASLIVGAARSGFSNG